MTDLRKGDVVIMVTVPPTPGQTVSRSSVWKGRNFTVSDVRMTPMGAGVLLSDGPKPEPGRLWDARAFRRTYRPDGSLISKLLEPVDLGEDAQ